MLREDPETAALADGLPEAPELLPENEDSFRIWQVVKNQVRAGKDGPYDFDLAAVMMVLEAFDVEDPRWELAKLQKLFDEMY